MDPLKRVLIYKMSGSQDSNLEPYGQEVKVREGVGLYRASALYHLLGCQMSKYPSVYVPPPTHKKEGKIVSSVIPENGA